MPNPDEPWETEPLFRGDSCPALAAAWERSRGTLADVRRRLASLDEGHGVETVAVAGSLGRCEQTAASDLDLIVVLPDGQESEDIAAQVGRSVWDRLESAAFPRPKPGGIFARPISSQTLCDAMTLGVVNEDMAAFGLRMQLLLEGRPVCGDGRFASLLRRILLRFLRGHGGGDNPWRPLVDDLLRYHRSLCVRYRAAATTEPGRWRELQLKAGFGRLTNVVGLLALLGDSLREADPLEAVLHGCRRTPLQRIAAAYRCHGDAGFARVCGLYEPFVAAFEDAGFRGRLNAAAEPDAGAFTAWEQLTAGARELKRELSRFLSERITRGDWPRQFCDDLLV